MWGAVSGGSWQLFRNVTRNSVTFVMSRKLFVDNPYTRVCALHLMQEDVANDTNITPAPPPRRISAPNYFATPEITVMASGIEGAPHDPEALLRPRSFHSPHSLHRNGNQTAN